MAVCPVALTRSRDRDSTPISCITLPLNACWTGPKVSITEDDDCWENYMILVRWVRTLHILLRKSLLELKKGIFFRACSVLLKGTDRFH